MAARPLFLFQDLGMRFSVLFSQKISKFFVNFFF